jgi:glycosyltransferase involved in cell wall biosynthesis
MRRASLILANIRETADFFPATFQPKVRILFNVGMHVEPDKQAKASPNTELSVLFVAHLRPLKGGTLALRSFRRLLEANVSARLHMIGQGPDLGRLTALAGQLGIADKVDFMGYRPRTEVLDWMHRCDLFLLPSLRDSGGLVLLEAMAAGKPVICLDLSGPGQIVTPECGFKIAPTTSEAVEQALANALLKLAGDPDLRHRMGQAGRCRVTEEFDWDKRGEQMMNFYREITTDSGRLRG